MNCERERKEEREREHESVDGTKESKAKRNAAKDMKAIEIIVRNFSALVFFSSLCIRFEYDFRFYSVLKRNDLIFVYFFAFLSPSLHVYSAISTFFHNPYRVLDDIFCLFEVT